MERDDMQRVIIKESYDGRKVFPRITIGKHELKHVTSVEFDVYPGYFPEFKFGTVGIPDIDVLGRVEINPSPTNLREACRIVSNELFKHGDFYGAFVGSVASVLKPKQRYVGDGCFCIDIDDDTDYKGLAEEIVKRISGEK